MTTLYNGSNNNFEIPKDLLKKAAESALVSSFVDLNTKKISPLPHSTSNQYQNPNPCHKVVIDLVAKKSPQDSYDTSVFVKVISKSSKSNLALAKEAKVYEEFIKAITKPVQILHIFPKCYLTHTTEDNVMIFMENLKSSGFRNFSPISGISTELDFNHALLAVENLARFHASSYFLQRQLGPKGKGRLELLTKFPFLKQNSYQESTIPSSTMQNIYANCFDRIICKIVEADNPSLAFKLRRKFDSSRIYEKIHKLLENEKYENDDFYVVCHGDYRSGNLLFKYQSLEEPTECRIVDLKHVRLAPITSDLTYLFFTSTSGKFRDEFEEKLLAFYCDAFEEHLNLRLKHNSVGLQTPKLEFDIEDFHRKLEDQYKRMLEYGFYSCCTILPLIFSGLPVSPQSLEGFVQEMGSTKDNKCEGFEKFVNECLSNAELKQRTLSIVKQLVKNRVL